MKAERIGNLFHENRASGMVLGLVVLFLLSASCSRPYPKAETPAGEPSHIKVEVKPGGPIVLTTS